MNQRSVDNIGINEFVIHSVFNKVISIENLYLAWREFRRGKTNKPDVVLFELNLEDNLFNLAQELTLGNYLPDEYCFFYVRDPKLRPIHKASVRDRVVFQAIFRQMYYIFDRRFIYDSYSCRFGKGTHAGIERLRVFLNKETNNYKEQVYVLKCDVKQFFYSIDHCILKDLIREVIQEPRLLKLIDVIIDSFHSEIGRGLPLGNVTSQLFANIYLNELDQFIKHELKCRFYIRYCDDFLILNKDKAYVSNLIPEISDFLIDKLKLNLHPGKVRIKKLTEGVDFLGYVTLSHHVVFRTKTKKRMFRRINSAINDFKQSGITEEQLTQVIQSYFGLLTHCNSHKLQGEIKSSIGNLELANIRKL